MKNFISVLLLLMIISCGPQKTITKYKETVKRDTIYKTTLKEVTKALHDTITINKPCDSLGNLKPFNHVIKTKKAKVSVTNVNGNIVVKTDIDSIVNVRINDFKTHYQAKIETKEIIKKVPNKFNWYLVLLNGVLLVALFRKQIPFLKWIPF